MLSCFVSLCLATAMGQAPASAEAAWLKSVPADVQVVVHAKALETVRDDLLGMLQKMSGNAAAMAGPQMEAGLNALTTNHGKEIVSNPVLAVMKLPKPGEAPAFAVLIRSTDYLGLLKGIAQKPDLKPKSLGGYDSFDGPGGQPFYSLKGSGFVAVGMDEGIIKAMIKPSASLDEKLSTEIKAKLFSGDLGVYVSIAAVQDQYGDQIAAMKEQFLAAMDQVGRRWAAG